MRGRTALRKTGKAVAVPPPVDVTGAPSAYFLRKKEIPKWGDPKSGQGANCIPKSPAQANLPAPAFHRAQKYTNVIIAQPDSFFQWALPIFRQNFKRKISIPLNKDQRRTSLFLPKRFIGRTFAAKATVIRDFIRSLWSAVSRYGAAPYSLYNNFLISRSRTLCRPLRQFALFRGFKLRLAAL